MPCIASAGRTARVVLVACAWLATAGAVRSAQHATYDARPDDCVDPAALEPIEGMTVAQCWRFDRDHDTEGWLASDGVAPLDVHKGTLEIRNVASDPQILGPPIDARGADYQMLALRCRSTSSGTTQVYFSGGTEFVEEQVIQFSMRGDGRWHTYSIDLRSVEHWSRPLGRMRIDPVNGDHEVGAEVEIDWIALYQAAAAIAPLLPRWKDAETLILAFENGEGRDADAPIEILCEGRPVATLACLETGSRAEAEIDARSLPAKFWLEAVLAGETIWRGRMVKPAEPAADAASDGGLGVARPDDGASISIGRGVGELAGGERMRVRLAPIASLMVRGPKKAITYYEFDVASRGDADVQMAEPIADRSAALDGDRAPSVHGENARHVHGASSPRLYEEWLDDPLLGTLLCTTSIAGTTVRTSIESSAALQVLRFEGPRMLESRPRSHALFPGLEYLEPGEDSSLPDWAGPREADRTSPSAHKITVPMIAVEYDRPQRARSDATHHRAPERRDSNPGPRDSARDSNPEPRDSARDSKSDPRDAARTSDANSDAVDTPRSAIASKPWVAALEWNIDASSDRDAPLPAAEFRSRRSEYSYATLFLPPVLESSDENHRFSARGSTLGALERLEIAERFSISEGTIEDVFAEQWIHRLPHPATLAWAAPDERVSEDERSGPGSRAAIEHIVATSMLAYTRTLYAAAPRGWKTHIAVGEPYRPNEQFEAVILAECARSDRAEYCERVGMDRGAQIENLIGTAASFVDDDQRTLACHVLYSMNQSGGIPYRPTPSDSKNIEQFTRFWGAEHATLGRTGTTEAGLLALQLRPLLVYAACTRDPVFVLAAERGLAQMNSFTVPRGAQSWEIDLHTPDLYAAALCVLADLWGWRMSGDERYLGEAERWAKTGLPFFYLWDAFAAARVETVEVADGLGEGRSLALRDPRLFYADTHRQVNPFASIPAFGTSWYAVSWFATPVQWCGLAWANAVRELDEVRPVPELVRTADGAFRSAANQQADSGYLAGTLPDSWQIANARSRQPFIVPERILEYAYRILGVADVGTIRYVRLAGSQRTYAASRALLSHVESGAARVAFDARFFRGQNASLIIGGSGGEPRSVLVNGRKLGHGAALDQALWFAWDGARGVLLVRWSATGADDRIEIVD